MGWFKGKKSKSGAGTEDEMEGGPDAVPSYSPEFPERQKSKLVHATSVQNFASIKAPEATVLGGRLESASRPGTYPRTPVPSPQPGGHGPGNPGAGLRPIATAAIPAPSSNTGSSEISVATPVHPAADNASMDPALNGSMDSLVLTNSGNGFFKPKEGIKGKGSYMQQQQQRILELEDEVTKLQQELAACDSARINAEQEANSKNAQVQSLMKQLTDMTSSPAKDEEAEAENQRSADDLHAALKAFREQSQSKLADTLRQNQELRYQVENYEAMCRTIGEVLRDYEWLQQCRIVTGDLDLGRLRKSMMKLWHSGKTRSVLPVLAMVLAFGPDDVQRCRSVISTAKQEADMVCYIPEIIEHNMDENMKRDAITIYIEAHKSQTEDTDIAMFLTDKFAEKYKGEWHCVVGEQYALSSCYESKVIKFKSGHRSVILWSN